ncbi:MAG: DUF2062 domain-containing protein [Opitutaceae bacterium]|nr:DUF2062 domain-containing protein [Opitutaceae bacterium]
MLRWLHRRHFSRPRLKGSRMHRWLGDHLMDKSLWRATPESLARAWLVGFPITSIPFLPGQSLIALALGFANRANLFLCVGLQYLSNPLTAIVHLPACYFAGKIIMGRSPMAAWNDAVTRDWGHALKHPKVLAEDIFELYLGGAVLGLLIGVAGYAVLHAWGERRQKKLATRPPTGPKNSTNRL